MTSGFIIVVFGLLTLLVLLRTHFLSFIHRKYHAPAPTDTPCTFPIDFVYTWVDGSDPYHLSLIESYNQPISYRRYANNNELYISLRSVSKFAPWVHRIFIVVADYQMIKLADVPDTLRDRIVVIHHSDIMPDAYTPHFASQVIESYLYRIPHLSEHFVYFNDDMFLGNTVSPNDFFHSDGSPYMLTDHSLDYYTNLIRYLLPKSTTRNSELRHSIRFFLSHFSIPSRYYYAFFKKPIHQCYPASKSLFHQIWETPAIHSFLTQQAKDKFRSHHQLNIFYLMYLFGLHTRTIYLQRESSQIFFEIHNFRQLKRRLHSLFRKRPKLFCINNELDEQNATIEMYFQNQLALYFS